MVNNKVVDNLLIYHVLNFHSHRPYGLRIIAITSQLSEILNDLHKYLFKLLEKRYAPTQ